MEAPSCYSDWYQLVLAFARALALGKETPSLTESDNLRKITSNAISVNKDAQVRSTSSKFCQSNQV